MSYETASIMCLYLEDVKLLGANLFAGYVRSQVKGILLSAGCLLLCPFAVLWRPDSSPNSWHGFPAQIRGGTRPVTKPLAGRVGTRIVGTIGGTAHRPRLHVAP